MALSVTITKKSVSRIQEKLYNVTVNMSLKDGGSEVLNRDFHVRYRTGDNISNKRTQLQEQMQDAINNYKTEQVLFAAAAFTNMCSSIQSGLVL